MERIVVGIDGSGAARAALEWVAARCAREPARVDLVDVVWDLTPDQRRSNRLLADAEQVVRDRVPDQPIQFHRAEGSVAKGLALASEDADLLVIGVDPSRPFKAALGGWEPVRIVARARTPVCVVPAGWTEGDGGVTVGLADDASSAAALSFAAREAEKAGTLLRIVHAWHLPDAAREGAAAVLSDPEAVLEHHRRMLEEAVQDIRTRHPDLVVDSELVRTDPVSALLGRAESSSVLVIGTHGEGVLAGGLRGAVGQDIFWRADRPVCVVPPVTR